MLRLTCLFLGVWGLLNAAQWLVDIHRWKDGTALGWNLRRLRRRRFVNSDLMAMAFRPTGLKVIALAQFASSTMLLFLPIGAATCALLAILTLTTLLLAQRSTTDGGDKMALVALAGALLQSIGLWCNDPILVLAGILWTGGQLTIAYFASGAAKLVIRRWRTGEALVGALSSDLWGNKRIASLLQAPGLAVIGAWALMLGEAAFPLALLLPTEWLALVLVGFLTLHLAIAFVMGLNHYVWAFLAAYPTVLLLGQWVRLQIF